ncbi:MAG TPA: TonB-dependent receptor [Thermoanaerobaculia bacterium]|jgi:iron complex outermembrane receptor protein|nr:TonB-dependent receptor [Thermoanaerobaculia bacterium]
MTTRSLPEVSSRIHRWRLLGLVAMAVVLLLCLLPAVARAQETPPPPEGQQETKPPEETQEEPTPAEEEETRFREEITVTGTRVEGRSATETPAPVDVIDSETIKTTGATETGKILQLLEPSFNFSSTTISDGTDIIRPATLRALGPDQVLVLVNGKRRHQQSLLNVQQTIARGSAGYDINTIPASAIDHIEVLRDGAAAQYGSDAIAGVINIILKNQTDRTDIALEGGQHYSGDGELLMGAANTGFAVGGKGFVDLTAEYRDRGETNRAGPDSLRVSPPRVTQRIGDADSEDASVWLNSAFPAGPGELYAFGGYSNRKGNSSGFFRSAGDGRTVPAIYPNGFLPTIITEPTDTSLAAGYRGAFGNGWKYDFGANYGDSEFKFREENTVNVSYWYEPVNPANPTGARFAESPTSADTGTLELDQLSFTADFTGKVDWGMGAGPLNIGAGAEYREEGYKITPGDPVSYQYGRTDNRAIRILDQTGAIAQPGTQGFPGWSPREAVDGDRNTSALYVDLESQLSQRFLAGAAVRWEDYSDFGSTVNGKLSGRIDFTDRFALRSTVSTGFRAPGVQQLFYSQRSTNLNAAGVLTDTLTARQDSDVTRAFGIPALKEETSRNYSVGLVAKPKDNFRVTVDLYRIDIDDRIVFSSNIGLGTSAAIDSILNSLNVGQVLFFTNAIDTSTDGLDIVALYDWKLAGDSLFSFEGAFHFNDTEVTKRRSSSSILPPAVLFDQSQVTLIEEGQPKEHFVLSGTYFRGDWKANLRFNYFGSVAGEGFTPGFKQTWGGKWLTDLSLTAPLARGINLTVGGLNIFDEYPDKWDTVNAFPFPQLGFVYGWETLPFGINGGYYFLRLDYRFGH